MKIKYAKTAYVPVPNSSIWLDLHLWIGEPHTLQIVFHSSEAKKILSYIEDNRDEDPSFVEFFTDYMNSIEDDFVGFTIFQQGW